MKETNKMDNTFATIVSMLPYNLSEPKVGLYPTEYSIAKAEPESFTLNIITNNAYYLVNPDVLSDAKDVHWIKVPVPAMELAQSIIHDYVSSLLAVTVPDAVPGLFAVQGNYTDKKEMIIKHQPELSFFRGAQNQWFRNLVDIADDTWAKTHSPITISDLQRDACRSLGYSRDWLHPLPSELIEKCPICKNPVNVGALKCVACGHILNKQEYEKVLAGTK